MKKSEDKNIGDQIEFDFNKVRWPSNEKFPLNLKLQNRSVESIIYKDVGGSEEYIIVTGFTSLSNIIDFFGSQDFKRLKKVRILIGFEPNIRGRKKYLKFNLDKEIKGYWLKKGLSIMLGGAVINLIEKINSGLVEFKYKDKLHAKLYVGDKYAVLGSSNFSKNGLNFQEEANIRVENSISYSIEKEQYKGIKLIANSYYEDASLYNKKMIELLENLIQKVTWEEALARAISEMTEGEWLKEYKDILKKLEESNLWPTQWKGLAQAISILQNQSNVLIADPTGAGKTKLCTSLVLALKHWLFEIGKNYRTDSLIICPPLVVSKWEEEFRSLKNLNNTRSMGILSNSSASNKRKITEELDIANILTVDEAHNYLSPTSNRTMLIKNNKADFKILVTATPISKKVEDLLRLIELLDIDNLSDEDFEIFKNLLHKPYLRNRQENIDNLRKFISKFTVRRTKKILNREILKEQDKYVNRLGKACKFPNQVELTYKTMETNRDIEIVIKINALTKKLKGITYLTTFFKPKYEMSNEDSLRSYIKRRVARQLYGEDLKHYEGWDLAKRLFYKGFIHTFKFCIYDPGYFKHRLFHELKRTCTYLKSPLPNYVGHHLAHAYSLLPCGLIKNTLILVSDALAENTSTSMYLWNGSRMDLIASSPYPNSIGSMFHQLAYHIGFEGRQGPGKLMALSGYWCQ